MYKCVYGDVYPRISIAPLWFYTVLAYCGVYAQVLEEADYEDNGSLTYTEFEHIISRAPDFLR